MTIPPRRPAIFFDRDGTLVEDVGYIRSPSEVVFYKDFLPALQKIKDHYLLFIVTNQPGIERGILSHEEVERVNQSILENLAHTGVTLSAVYYCPHTREQGCRCIKPKPYFLLKAAEEFCLDLPQSFVIGDHPHDIEFARNAGARGIYLLTGHGQKHLDEVPQDGEIFIAGSLDEAVTWILEEDSKNQRLK